MAGALAPFALAMLARIVLGKSRLTRTLIYLGTMWFAINVFMAPLSSRMTQDLRNLPYLFH